MQNTGTGVLFSKAALLYKGLGLQLYKKELSLKKKELRMICFEYSEIFLKSYSSEHLLLNTRTPEHVVKCSFSNFEHVRTGLTKGNRFYVFRV